MKPKEILAVVLSCIWISISEFSRNTFMLHRYWLDHYRESGMVFPEQPINGAVWGIWATVFSAVLLILLRKFSFWQTVFLGWVAGFAMMWLVIGNLGVLPFGILPVAIPLSFVEVLVAVFLIRRVAGEVK